MPVIGLASVVLAAMVRYCLFNGIALFSSDSSCCLDASSAANFLSQSEAKMLLCGMILAHYIVAF